jgi:signal transduction histidine kinase
MAEAAKQNRAQKANENSIEHISQISKDLIGNMRDLIWVLNPENTTLDNLAARIREYAGDYLEGFGIELQTQFPEQIPALQISREGQRNIFLTIKEAIHNSIKHSGATLLHLSMQIDADMLLIKIQDNGRGFETARSKSDGNGLRNMKLRIESIGGAISLKSKPGEGVCIQIGVPLPSLINNTFV